MVEELRVDPELVWVNKGKLRWIALLPGKGRCSHAWFNARRSKSGCQLYMLFRAQRD